MIGLLCQQFRFFRKIKNLKDPPQKARRPSESCSVYSLDVCEVGELGLVFHVLDELPDAVVGAPVGQLRQVVHLKAKEPSVVKKSPK